MNFGEALQLIKSGARVARIEWMGGGPRDGAPSVRMQHDGHGDGPWMYLLRPATVEAINDRGGPAEGGRSPWSVSQPDLLADDWVVVEAARGLGAPGSSVERAAVEVVRAYAERDEHGAMLAVYLLDPMVALDDALTAAGVST